MKWSIVFAFVALTLGVSATPVKEAEAVPEALYVIPIKYAEFEEDA
jgi:hypothetical protein